MHHQVKLRFFARYREALGIEQCDLQIPARVDSVAALLSYLEEERPHWREVLGAADKLIAVNQKIVPPQHPLEDSDEVALMPPVTGG